MCVQLTVKKCAYDFFSFCLPVFTNALTINMHGGGKSVIAKLIINLKASNFQVSSVSVYLCLCQSLDNNRWNVN